MHQRTFTPNTNLGQNFLINREIVRQIIVRANLNSNDVVLEIGPGQGVLSRAILESPCSHLHSVEIDRRLESYLRDCEGPRFSLHWGDGVTFPYETLTPCPNKVVANIPYHVTTPLLWALLEKLAPLGLQYLILMVQKEAADRLVAHEGTKDRYPLGIAIEAMGQAKVYMKVSPGSFRPIPRVHSALVEIWIDDQRELAQDSIWRRILRGGFAQRRKKLTNNLTVLGYEKNELLSAFEQAGISPSARAEDLTSDQWLALRRAIQ
ncbi:MAG: ribosomal RNA small subunit methyltransferase A [Dethiosulfovibrio peptidovorans]|nr:MAG: ribosomal RNA small subunit methyltransferase A [Dethiosulfovibrio peptidovorans]